MSKLLPRSARLAASLALGGQSVTIADVLRTLQPGNLSEEPGSVLIEDSM